jgi:hypothetical protein
MSSVTPPSTKTYPLQRRLEACRKLADYADQTFDGAAVSTLFAEPRGLRMLLASWGRQMASFRSAIALAEQGYGEQVGMIARALFEGTVDAYWIVSHPIKADADLP